MRLRLSAGAFSDFFWAVAHTQQILVDFYTINGLVEGKTYRKPYSRFSHEMWGFPCKISLKPIY